MKAGTIVLLSGAGATLLGGVLLWRGWARYHTCTKAPDSNETLCTFWNAPLMAGTIVAPLGFTGFLVGGALMLIQGKGS
jgi:hypothetical protein